MILSTFLVRSDQVLEILYRVKENICSGQSREWLKHPKSNDSIIWTIETMMRGCSTKHININNNVSLENSANFSPIKLPRKRSTPPDFRHLKTCPRPPAFLIFLLPLQSCSSSEDPSQASFRNVRNLERSSWPSVPSCHPGPRFFLHISRLLLCKYIIQFFHCIIIMSNWRLLNPPSGRGVQSLSLFLMLFWHTFTKQ